MGKFAMFAIAAFGLIAVAPPVQQANADTMYFGWDFGNGFGLGIGAPPSAHGMHYCGPVATYGRCYNPWPL